MKNDIDKEFYQIIDIIVSNKNYQRLKNFRQHYDTSIYEHCYKVAYYGYKVAKKLGLDYVSLARAAMLHDFYLYDWRLKKEYNRHGFHAFTHPKTACTNASILFDLSEKEKSMILTHMWPVTITDIPKSKEAFILTLVDKYSAIKESVCYYKKALNSNLTLKYASLLFGFVILRLSKIKAFAFLSIFKFLG